MILYIEHTLFTFPTEKIPQSQIKAFVNLFIYLFICFFVHSIYEFAFACSETVLRHCPNFLQPLLYMIHHRTTII